ncbi:MAG TPA: amino acid permease, partial [Clostridia bacterium]|nr:amino acid permease [Clostridia bacterium]
MGEATVRKPVTKLTKPRLGFFDVTCLVIGAIVGADIYVASSFGAGLLGPAALVAWVAAGVMAAIIALSFAQAAMLVPRVGGSYEYVREAFGPAAGFAVGWSLWLAEWISLAAFPIAFSRYLNVLFPLGTLGITVAKVIFMSFVTASNYLGAMAAGRVNDVLTVAKMGPLAVFALLGVIKLVADPVLFWSRLAPFAPLGWSGFGPALVTIFWAYAGFELAVIPAEDIENPRRTIPVAIGLGIS